MADRTLVDRVKDEARGEHENREEARRSIGKKRGTPVKKGKKTRGKGPGSFRQKDAPR